jgi:dinuclear metal center YbgI/SA1388 family protein
MAYLMEIDKYLQERLQLNNFNEDYSNNGLQVEGKKEIKKIGFGVDASEELFKDAASMGADMIFVHHGISWGKGIKYFSGRFGNLLKILFQNDISLYAAHLPLDAHPILGHNALIADMIGLQQRYSFGTYCGTNIGYAGKIDSLQVSTLGEELAKKLNSTFKIYGKNRIVSKIGIISGGSGSDGIEEAAASGLECLVTGEVGHSSWHLIKELGINVISCGHYKTEVPGVKAIQNDLLQQFDIQTVFIDIPTGL